MKQVMRKAPIRTPEAWSGVLRRGAAGSSRLCKTRRCKTGGCETGR